MHYNPTTDRHGLKFNPFKSCTVPRPIGWLSSISPAGVCSLGFAAVHILQPVPMPISTAARRSSGGTPKAGEAAAGDAGARRDA